jgi:hypothetical protein
MQKVKPQTFDFTSEDNQQEIKNWKAALSAIPFTEKNGWLNNNLLSKEELAEIEFSYTHQFIDIDEDTWFWMVVYFLKNGKVNIGYVCNYSIGQEDELLLMVNTFCKEHDLEEADELNALPSFEKETWQEGYDLLCSIARKEKVAAVKINDM